MAPFEYDAEKAADDAALLRRVRDDRDDGAFEVLYARYRSLAKGYLYRKLERAGYRNPDAAAEDVLGDAFATLLVRVIDGGYREEGRFWYYLLGVLRNCLREHMRREGKQAHAPIEGAGEAAEKGRRPGDPTRRQMREDLEDAIERLQNPRHREALRLVYFRGMSLAEAATEMGAKLQDLKNWTFQGRRRLRAMLAPGYAEER